tara:strand:- start:43 stop:396 length:354 start_codon:yes stop_codon:yes gene_type:complete
MAINSDTDITLALIQLGKSAKNSVRLSQSIPPHEILEWDSSNPDSQPTDDELNTAYTAWKNAEEYKIKRTETGSTTYAPTGEQMAMIYDDIIAGKLDATGSFAIHNKAVKDANPKPS